MTKRETQTTAGIPIGDNQNSITAGRRRRPGAGPAVRRAAARKSATRRATITATAMTTNGTKISKGMPADYRNTHRRARISLPLNMSAILDISGIFQNNI